MPLPPDIPDRIYARLQLHAPVDLHQSAGPDKTSTKARTITATLATYGSILNPMSHWGGPIRLAAGALESPAELNAVKLLRDHDASRVIGAMTAYESDDTGAKGSFRLARTPDADEAFILAEDGILDSVSAGYTVHDAQIILTDDQEVLEVTRATLFEVSLVGRPADTQARIESVTARKAPAMEPILPILPAPAAGTDLTTAQLDAVLAHVRDNMAPAAAAPLVAPQISTTRIVGPDGKPVVLASERRDARIPTAWGRDGKPYTAGDYFAAYAEGAVFGNWTRENEIRGALADELVADIPGLLPTAIIGELLGRASGRRPVWESMSPRDMPMSGAKFSRPRITQHALVGDRGTEKTNPPSRKFKVMLDEVAKKTFAGGLDVSNEALDWSSPSLLNELIIDFTRVYAFWTDTYASSSLINAQVTGNKKVVWDGTAAKLTGALAEAAVLVAQGVDAYVDAFPNTIWISLDIWAKLAGLTDTTGRPLLPNLGPTNATGTFDLTDPTSGPAQTGFRWVVGRQLPTGTFIMGDREFTEAYENGRRLLQAQNVPQLGLDIATSGYGATYFPYPTTLVAIGPAASPGAR